jgi:amino acid adenylation domain-containing protein
MDEAVLERLEGTEETEDAGTDLFIAPVSFAQRRLWLLDRVQPGSATYNVPLAVRVHGPLRTAALAATLAELVARHETLRTSFGEEEGEPVQVIAPELRLGLPVIDLRELGAPEREHEARRLTADEARRPFDLHRAPLLRAHLLRLAGEEHLLVLVLHHIVTDGWSLSILVRELSAVYTAFSAGLPSPLPGLPIQYADFADWQRQWLQGEVLEQKLRPWRQRLAGAPAGLDLPTDRPRSLAGPAEGRCGFLALSLGASLSAAVRQLARASGTTLYMTLLAGFQALLFRHSGQADLVVGSPVANRNRTEIEGLIGFFVNVLALRGDLSGDPSFQQFLERVREVAVEALAHEDLPFEKLVEELRPDRRLQRTPLFSVLFVLQQPQDAPTGGEGLRWELEEVQPATSKFELSLHLVDDPAEIHGSWEFDAGLFDKPTVARLGRHLQALFAGAAAHPGRRIGELSLLTDGERHQVAVEWNDTASLYPRQETIHGLFAAQAARTPEAPALVFEDAGSERAVTYGELARRARRLARHLRALGVGTEKPVGIFLERGPEMIESWLGTLEAGGAYLPLDPAYPAERLAFMLRDARVACVITRREIADRLPSGTAITTPLLCLDEIDEIESEAPLGDRNVDGGAGPDTLAYVIYTSGSTGKPKGVAVTHRSVLRLVCNTNFLGFDSADRMAQIASSSFDLAVLETWGALLHGAPLVLFDRETAVSPESLARALVERRIGTAFLTSTVFHRIASLDPAAFRGFHNLLVGGETVDPSRAAEVLAAGPPVRLVNSYGPTECTVFACCQWVREVPPGAATVPIGPPISNTTAVVLDAGLEPVPVGVTGELYLGGDGLARGYLGRPDLTAERFVPAPLELGGAITPGARLYRTGDLARLRADGAVDCLGRADHQIKIRGVRIEPGEVEAALGGHPAVAECAVGARRNAAGEPALVAWVVPRCQPAPSAQELREHLQGKLPDAFVPAAFVAVEALPRTPNGKLDRAALPDPDAAGGAAGPGFVPPRTPVEEVLAGIFASVLRIDQSDRSRRSHRSHRSHQIGAFDNFFDLGGHSLNATQATSLVRSTFQVELPTRAIFKEPTLAALAEQIETLLLAREGLALPPIIPVPRGPVPREPELPLSFAQQRLWFLEELAEGETPFHNICAALLLTGRLDAAALAGAFGEIVRRHEALRTTFRTGPAGTPVQTVRPHRPFLLSLTDLTGLPLARREPEAHRLAVLDAGQPFPLSRGPLLRANLVRLDPERNVVLLCMHHIVADGSSLEVFVRELAALYRATGAFAAGQPPPLPELPIQYADFAAWQRKWLSGPVLETQLAFWRQQLAGIPLVLDLVTDRPRPPLQSYTGQGVPVRLPEPLAGRLHALARQHRATLFMALLTGFSALLRRYTGRRDLLVGSPIANRNRAETAGLIGCFVNLLTLRADLSGNPDFAEALGRVREMALGAYAHQDLPFERLVEELERARDLSRHPLFQVSFSMGGTPWHAFDLPGLSLGFLDVPTPVELYDLTFQVFETSQGLRALLSYNSDLFDASSIARMGRHLEILLEAFAGDPLQRVDAVSLLSEDERRQLLEDRPPETPAASLVPELFEQQAARQPAAPALLWDGGELSYEELDRRSNRLARHLCTLGVGPEVPVALCLDRTADFAVALLATWKAGGAALPLDPEAPPERLGWMLDDSRAKTLVSRSTLAPAARPGLSVVLLDADRSTLARQRSEPLPHSTLAALPEAAAYILYTSGSTGAPKGVLVPHSALASHCREMARRLELGPEDRVLQTAGFTFDVALEEMLTAWIAGAAVVPWDARRGPAELSRVLASEAVTVANLPTPLWHQAAREWAAGRVSAEAPHLRWMIAGSEALPAGSLALWRRTPFAAVPLANAYGTTETTITATFHVAPAFDLADQDAGPDLFRMAIGRPLSDRSIVLLDVLDGPGEPVPASVPGEICVGGPALARGYPGRPDLTAAAFVPDPWSPVPGARLYRTGDLARRRGDGALEHLGRLDHQIKLRGYRIEPGEVEAALLEHPGIQAAAVGLVDLDGTPETRSLAAWIVPADGSHGGGLRDDLRDHLRSRLPAWMVPGAFHEVPALPLTAGGKIDRAALARLAPRHTLPPPAVAAAPAAPPSIAEAAAPIQDSLDDLVTDLWREALGLGAGETIRPDASFFDIGGHSMLLSWVRAKLQERLGTKLSMIDLFNAPTVRSLAASLRREIGAPHPQPLSPTPSPRPGEGSTANFPLSRGLGGRVGEGAGGEGSIAATSDIAIIGMAGQFPGARNVDELWRNLADGVESITFFAPEGKAWRPPGGSVFHVPARGVLPDGSDGWDAAFFGYSAREAELMDPQHRLFLECAWQALENAGYDPGRCPGPVGVFGGASRHDYLALLVASGAFSDLAGSQIAGLGTEIDFLTTRVSYKLGLEGPSFDVQAACATSLVAVHLACQSLLAGECSLALAGAVAVTGQPEAGYVFQEGGQQSPDGHCRAFDARGQGSVDADGVALVVLKRLADALADGDHVHAVIKATGVNNDGSDKMGFLAPRQESQSRLIRSTLERAGITADTIGLVEGHGNATPLGDPIEVAALTEAFRADTARTGFCALGSIKSNLGHLHGAAGAASLIKAVLALEHRLIPPSLHFEQTNPALALESSPFFVTSQSIPWETPEGHPRRAGVSSFGAGGTKVHIVLEEAPVVDKDLKDCKDPKDGKDEKDGWQLLVLSARTATALDRAAEELADYLERHPELPLADVAFTLQMGRKPFEHRRAVLCRDLGEALAGLRAPAADLPAEADLPEPARDLATLGRRWLAGMTVDWPALHTSTRRRRVPLPTYPFEKQRYWVETDGLDIPRFAPPEELRPEPGLPGSGR